MLLVPLMVAPVIAAIMMRWMFNDQFGIVNAVLEGLGLEGQPWLVERWTAFGVILLTDIWLWTPWFTLLLLAGLQSLPKEPFEAAAIDGTSTWRVFTHLTLPMLQPVIVVCVVIRAIDAFRTFDIVWTLTGGGPGRSTELFSLYAYVLAFLNLDLGRGSAAAIVGGLIILVVGIGLYRAGRPRDEEPDDGHGPPAPAVRPPAARRRGALLFGLALFAICFLFAFPVLWLILTSLRPEFGRLLRPSRHRVHPRRASSRCCRTSGWSRPSSIRR